MDRVETKLQFAVRFSQMDLSVLSDGEWLKLKEDLWRLMGSSEQFIVDSPAAEDVYALPDEEAADYTNQQVIDLQRETAALIREWSAQKSEDELQKLGTRPAGSPPERDWNDYLVLQFPRQFRVQTDSSGGHLFAQGDARTLFIFVLSMLLLKGGGDTLRQCGECGNIFSKRGRRKFCSTRCLNTSTKRRYRSKKK